MRIEDIEKRLEKIHLFNDLSSSALTAIAEIAQLRFYKQNMYVYMENDLQDRIFFISSGKVKIYKTDFSGKEQLLNVLETKEMFPHAGFFTKGSYQTHAEVLEDAVLIVIPMNKFQELLLLNQDLFVNLARHMGNKIIDLENRLEEQILHNSYEKVILLLLRLCKSNGIKMGDQYQLTTHFTNKELANMIGTTRETVNRTINHLKKKNYIMHGKESSFLINQIALKQEILQ